MKKITEADVLKLVHKNKLRVPDEAPEDDEDEGLVHPSIQALTDIANAINTISSSSEGISAKLQKALVEVLQQLKVERPMPDIPAPIVNVEVPQPSGIREWEFVIIRDSKGLIERIKAIAK